MYAERKEIISQLEKIYNSKVLVYVTSDRRGLETQIGQDVIDLFINHLDNINTDKISLVLYTRGGDTAAAWNIVNLLKMYCDQLEVIIPHKAHSAGTLISIGANKIIMTKQATLGPIDPSLNTPLNPPLKNGHNYPVSVEAVKGYFAYAKDELGIKDDNALSNIMIKLSEFVHPLVLGQVYRTRAQIQMLAKKLLLSQIKDNQKIESIISFLCSDSGSHDYTINRREALNLGLSVEKPNPDQYDIIKRLYDDISSELQLTDPYDIRKIDGPYVLKRAVLESLSGGSHKFISEGKVSRRQMPNGQQGIQDERIYEGWREDNE